MIAAEVKFGHILEYRHGRLDLAIVSFINGNLISDLQNSIRVNSYSEFE